MSVPKYFEFYNAFLESLSDGKCHDYNDCKDFVSSRMKLSDSDLAQLTASGYALWVNRLGWCTTYLKKAGLVISPARSKFQITNDGKKLLKEKVTITDALLTERYPSFAEFKSPSKKKPDEYHIESKEESEETPTETLERVFNEINSKLSDEILSAVLAMSPSFFERLVVQLMEAMRYGGYSGAGFVTKASGDGGIDGIINEDQLGFNVIYIQAKRWALDTVISKPEIQKFVGALMGPPRIEKGLYITTARFSKGAEEYAKAQHVILVDGEKLSELMIKFNIGVTTQSTYQIKRIDTDYFDE
ncbi:MAG: restriction endonuclease [Oscillospiraceae bacterium]|nr:restriction endonuclease [Oscillospiraceae bacterium]